MLLEMVRCNICQGQAAPEVLKTGGWFSVPDKNIHFCPECYQKARKFSECCEKNGIKIPREDELASVEALAIP